MAFGVGHLVSPGSVEVCKLRSKMVSLSLPSPQQSLKARSARFLGKPKPWAMKPRHFRFGMETPMAMMLVSSVLWMLISVTTSSAPPQKSRFSFKNDTEKYAGCVSGQNCCTESDFFALPLATRTITIKEVLSSPSGSIKLGFYEGGKPMPITTLTIGEQAHILKVLGIFINTPLTKDDDHQARLDALERYRVMSKLEELYFHFKTHFSQNSIPTVLSVADKLLELIAFDDVDQFMLSCGPYTLYLYPGRAYRMDMLLPDGTVAPVPASEYPFEKSRDGSTYVLKQKRYCNITTITGDIKNAAALQEHIRSWYQTETGEEMYYKVGIHNCIFK